MAPAGNVEMLCAAVRCGADAVYIGLQRFSARAFADNFTVENLHETVGYCHARGVRVFVAINTLIFNGELDELANTIRSVALCGVDAVIVQDMAVISMIKDICPDLPVHASTQCSALTPSAVRTLADFGFKRVVIGREASLEVMKTAAEQTELEVFVHGALCYSVSGACYMSAFLGGRSANRGSCASPCRLMYKSDEQDRASSLLSLRDLSTLSHLPQLAAAGVSAYKIEGRMRTPEYAAAAVSCAVRARDGLDYDVETLEGAFSHGGFTTGHLYDGNKSDDIFGTRTERDGERTKKLLPGLRALYRTERPSMPVSAKLILTDHELSLSLTCKEHRLIKKVSVETQPTEKDQTDALKNALCKTGGTQFFIEDAELNLRPGVFVPSREVANLRRELLEELSERLSIINPHSVNEYSLPTATIKDDNHDKKLRLRVSDIAQLEFIDVERFEYIIIPAEQIEKIAKEHINKAIVEISRGCDDKTTERYIKYAESLGYTHFMVENPAHIALCPKTRHGGFGLNITNRIACEFYNKQNIDDFILSVEVSAFDCRLFCENVGVIGYGHLPLMLSAACHEKVKGELIDRKGRHLGVNHRDGFVEIIGAVPLYIGDRKREFSVDFFTLYMTNEAPKRVAEVVKLFCDDQPFDGEFTRGLYY